MAHLQNRQSAITTGLNAEQQAQNVVRQANRQTQQEQNAVNQTTEVTSSMTTPVITPSQNRSGLSLASGDNVGMILTDPLGRRTGYDVVSGKEVRQIPNSSYSSEAISSSENPSYIPPTGYFIDINQPMDGDYELTLIGNQGIIGSTSTNNYDLQMSTFFSDGLDQSDDELTGRLLNNQATFHIHFVASPDSSSTIQATE